MLKIPVSLLTPNNNHLIIAFEGVDGCGKTSLCEKLEEFDNRIHFTRIPTAYTQRPFKDHLAFNTTHISSALIYAGSLVDRKRVIDEYDVTDIAVTDRSIWSTLTLLYARHPESVQEMIDVFAAISQHLPVPDIVYVLDVPFSICQERIMARSANVRKYDDMMQEEYNKHLEFYHLLKDSGVNIRFVNTEKMSYEDEIRFVMGDIENGK
jgi:thymidylate kinase